MLEKRTKIEKVDWKNGQNLQMVEFFSFFYYTGK